MAVTTTSAPVDRPAAVSRPDAGPGRRGFRVVLGLELVAAALLYTVGAARSGWANAFYAAATQAGAQSWHAYLYGALDPSGGITIDKPPGAIWLMALSARVFGLSPTSLLWPQAACGVATVALLVATVRRQAGDAAGLIAGGLLAVTPVVTLLARYDNPDALMMLLLVAAGYAVTRAVDRAAGGTGWLVAAGTLLGLAFLTKLGQALLVLPGLALVVLVAAPGPLWRRFGRLLAGGAAMVLAAGWWVALVELTPAADRPYIGGSTDNSVIGLALGYDGLARVTGASGRVSIAHWGRLLGSGGDQGGWFLPAALVLLVAGAVLVRRRRRTDPELAGLVLWGGWLLVAGAVLSGLQGTSHSYYSVQIAPATAAVCAIVGVRLWAERRTRAWPGRLLAGVVVGSALWTAWLLLRSAVWPAALVLGIGVAAGIAAAGLLRPGGSRRVRRVVAAALLVSVLAGPAAWSVATAAAVHQGASPAAGPGTSQPSHRAGLLPGTPVPVAVADVVARGAAGYRWAAGVPGRRAADLQLATGAPVFELGGYGGRDPAPTLAQFQQWVATGQLHYLVLADGVGTAGPGTTVGAIQAWALHRFTGQQLAGWTILDLTTAATR